MKNKIRIGTIGLLSVVACLIAFSSCLNPVKDYFEDSKYEEVHGTIKSHLESNPEYASFLEIMRQTGTIELLENNMLLTLWIPLNSTMTDEVATLSLEKKRELVYNHISASAIYSHNIANLVGSYVQDFNGKYMSVTGSNGMYYLDGIPLINLDIVCDNGVIHELGEWILPRPSLYDWLTSLPGEYSIFCDSLLKSRTITTFDRENSIIGGVEADGTIWYSDSITISTNAIFEASGDPSDLKSKYTIFVPNNAAVIEMYQTMTEYMDKVKYPMVSDSVMWMEWLMKACIHDGLVEYVPGATFIASAGSMLSTATGNGHMIEFKTDYQLLEDGSEKEILSNGWGYTLGKINVPRDIYFKNVITLPDQYRSIHGSNNTSGHGYARHTFTYGTVFGKEDVRMDRVRDNKTIPASSADSSWYGPVISTWEDNTVAYQFGGNEDAQQFQAYSDFFYEYWTGGASADSIWTYDVMPGRYTLSIRLLNKVYESTPNATDSIKMYINTKSFGAIKGITDGDFTGSNGQVWRDASGSAKILDIPGQYGPAVFKIWMYKYYGNSPTLFRAWRRLQVGRTALIPADNYDEIEDYAYPYDPLRDSDTDEPFWDSFAQYPWLEDWVAPAWIDPQR